MKSIGARFASIVVLTSAVVGAAGYFAGQSAMEQVAALSDDQEVEAALEDGRKALRDWSKLRQAHAAAQLEACATARQLDSCVVTDASAKITIIPAPKGDIQAHWLNERTYTSHESDGRAFEAVLDWPEIKPRFDKFSEVLGRREHLVQLLPDLLASFLATFAAALVAAALCGLLATWLLSRRLVARVGALINYTRRIGQGQLVQAPASTRGRDEVGLLSEALERMAIDLDTTRQRLILTEKMESWQQVARKVAHEIKNPLTPISLVAAELQRQAPQQEPRLKAFLVEAGRVLYEECSSLERMVRDFTRFARLPHPELLSGDLWETVSDFVQRNSASDGPELILQEPGVQQFPVVHDAAMIAQVLHNLVNNAVRAKAPERVRVRFAAVVQGASIRLDIADDAGGVPESLRSTLFDAYVTSRSTGDGEKGMGLGLAIARKIALDHGGSLELTETGAAGSVFTLVLPLSHAIEEHD